MPLGIDRDLGRGEAPGCRRRSGRSRCPGKRSRCLRMSELARRSRASSESARPVSASERWPGSARRARSSARSAPARRRLLATPLPWRTKIANGRDVAGRSAGRFGAKRLEEGERHDDAAQSRGERGVGCSCDSWLHSSSRRLLAARRKRIASLASSATTTSSVDAPSGERRQLLDEQLVVEHLARGRAGTRPRSRRSSRAPGGCRRAILAELDRVRRRILLAVVERERGRGVDRRRRCRGPELAERAVVLEARSRPG